MDSIIREESSLADSGLFKLRPGFKSQKSPAQPIKTIQSPLKIEKGLPVNPLALSMASKKKMVESEKKPSAFQKNHMNAELSKLLNFTKKLDEMRPGTSKLNSSKQNKISLNFSMKPVMATPNKKNTSFAIADPTAKRHASIASSSIPTETLSTRMTPKLNNSTFSVNETMSPLIHRFVITKKDKLLELNYRIPHTDTFAQDQKLINNFKQGVEPMGKFIPTAKYPYVFTDMFQSCRSKDKRDNLAIDMNRLHNYEEKNCLKWQEGLRKKMEKIKINRLVQ